MNEDHQLLLRFCRDASESAFRQLIEKHLPLVYSTASRMTNGSQQLAEDVVQEVFIHLASKARAISPRVILAGWLYQDTRFTALRMLRQERRRIEREKEAVAMHAIETSGTETDWTSLRPVLDEILGKLNEEDRNALVLRLLQSQPLSEVAQVLGLTEDAARMRIRRALERLRNLLQARGITTTSSALSLALTSHALESVPAGLAQRITKASSGAAGIFTAGLLPTLLAHAFTTLGPVAKLLALAAALGIACFAFVAYKPQPPAAPAPVAAGLPRPTGRSILPEPKTNPAASTERLVARVGSALAAGPGADPTEALRQLRELVYGNISKRPEKQMEPINYAVVNVIRHPKPAFDLLREAVKDEDNEVRIRAARCIQEFCWRHSYHTGVYAELKATIPDLRQALETCRSAECAFVLAETLLDFDRADEANKPAARYEAAHPPQDGKRQYADWPALGPQARGTLTQIVRENRRVAALLAQGPDGNEREWLGPGFGRGSVALAGPSSPPGEAAGPSGSVPPRPLMAGYALATAARDTAMQKRLLETATDNLLCGEPQMRLDAMGVLLERWPVDDPVFPGLITSSPDHAPHLTTREFTARMADTARAFLRSSEAGLHLSTLQQLNIFANPDGGKLSTACPMHASALSFAVELVPTLFDLLNPRALSTQHELCLAVKQTLEYIAHALRQQLERTDADPKKPQLSEVAAKKWLKQIDDRLAALQVSEDQGNASVQRILRGELTPIELAGILVEQPDCSLLALDALHKLGPAALDALPKLQSFLTTLTRRPEASFMENESTETLRDLVVDAIQRIVPDQPKVMFTRADVHSVEMIVQAACQTSSQMDLAAQIPSAQWNATNQSGAPLLKPVEPERSARIKSEVRTTVREIIAQSGSQLPTCWTPDQMRHLARALYRVDKDLYSAVAARIQQIDPHFLLETKPATR